MEKGQDGDAVPALVISQQTQAPTGSAACTFTGVSQL
jgi:hypothetical protein